MDRAAALNRAPAASGEPGGCPRCLEPLGPLAAVRAPIVGAAIGRCLRCGTRIAGGAERDRTFLFHCESCNVPFESRDLLAHGARRCTACRDGRIPSALPEPEVLRAIEAELRVELGVSRRFVESPGSRAYFHRIATEVAEHLEDRPERPEVALFEDSAVRTFALPSGTVMLSTGALASLRDEAELAFAIGHELAHAAASDAALQLLRLGFPGSGASWADGLAELQIVGYGRRRERDADRRAIEAIRSRGWDPASAMRWLSRLDVRAARGDVAVADLVVSHPTCHDRVRHIERALYGLPIPAEGYHVNREVFERAVGGEALASELRTVPFVPGDDPGLASAVTSGIPRSIRVLVALGALVGLASLVALLATR